MVRTSGPLAKRAIRAAGMPLLLLKQKSRSLRLQMLRTIILGAHRVAEQPPVVPIQPGVRTLMVGPKADRAVLKMPSQTAGPRLRNRHRPGEIHQQMNLIPAQMQQCLRPHQNRLEQQPIREPGALKAAPAAAGVR